SRLAARADGVGSGEGRRSHRVPARDLLARDGRKRRRPARCVPLEELALTVPARQPVDRAARAKTLPVKRATAALLKVQGSESEYDLAIAADGTVGTCPCPDARIRNVECAHMIAGRLFLERERERENLVLVKPA